MSKVPVYVFLFLSHRPNHGRPGAFFMRDIKNLSTLCIYLSIVDVETRSLTLRDVGQWI